MGAMQNSSNFAVHLKIFIIKCLGGGGNHNSIFIAKTVKEKYMSIKSTMKTWQVDISVDHLFPRKWGRFWKETDGKHL